MPECSEWPQNAADRITITLEEMKRYWPVAGSLVLLLVAIAVIATSRGDEQPKGEPRRVTVVASSGVTPILPAVEPTSQRLTPSPSLAPTPASVLNGSTQRVWVYEDSRIMPTSCLDLLPDMVPYTAPSSTSGKSIEC